MKPLQHVMILASAGSGKTYALTNRFVRLLAGGARPERIVALTFTRKAAGEFFDEILNKLARAAAEEKAARQLAADVGLSSGDDPRAPFRRMLRDVVDAMHRLRLGTLDGFFARIASNFPLELGLGGEFEILQAHASQVERGRVLRRMFERSGELGEAQREFIEAFKRATFGVDEKRLAAQLDGFLDRHQEIFLSAPRAECWGAAERIWPDGADWRGASARRDAALRTLQGEIERAELNDKQRARWRGFFDELAVWLPGAPMGDALEYLVNNALKAWPELAEIVVERKKQLLTPALREALRDVLLAMFEMEFARRLEMTRGIHEVLASYDAVYHQIVRRAGKLTFADVQRLLQPDCGAPRLSAAAGEEDEADAFEAAERRLLIDYRLDGEIDHWLLDEFQDTSFGQWSILRNLIDEVMQDPTGARSFFYVGDVKQAIFAWREGDPRLFREIFNHYNSIQPGTIAEEHLVQSWRSGPAVIEAVNQVFGDAAVLAELFPGEASKTWNAEWRRHDSARPKLDGQVALLQGADEAERFALTVGILQEIDPLGRGLSCAVLVQGNAMATRLADYLRHEGGLPAVAESDLHVCIDNPLGAALLALAKAAAHPGDTLAQQHVRMTPLGALLDADGLAAPEAVTRRVLGDIHAEGFERALSGWTRRLVAQLPAGDAFTRERAGQFLAAAAAFDETGSRDVAEFLAFMERHTIREMDTAGSVRVMTIHKSKGLGFDVVVLPDLEGIRLDCRRDGLAVQKSVQREVEWVLDLPPKTFHAQDPVLAAHVKAAEADACYEALSLLYVAMTRAKRAMYLVTKSAAGSTSRNYPKLLAETLGDEVRPVRIGAREFAGVYANGNYNWHVGVTAPAAVVREPEAPAVSSELAAGVRRRRLPARQPSAAKTARLNGAQLFSVQRGAAAAFGTAVHALLAEVEWFDRDTAGRLRVASAGEEGTGAAAEALACLEEPALAGVWRRPGAAAEAWRERAFEVVIDGAWITGVFDRVVVERDAAGRARRATVYDFKTDQPASGEVAPLVERYAAQLNLYRRVAAILAAVPEREVEAVLVFTRLRRAVPVGGR
ncbi:MAG TPA: UvrD-helicase domain-containing protein [Opitutus sp.]|nr:UvrD-helicase domain-containing protein [Opitutus sp.]